MRHSKCAPSLPVTYHPSPRSLTCSPLTYQLSPRSGPSGYQNRVHKKHEYLIICPVCPQLHAFLSDRLITWGKAVQRVIGTLPNSSAHSLAIWQPAPGAIETPLLSAKAATAWQSGKLAYQPKRGAHYETASTPRTARPLITLSLYHLITLIPAARRPAATPPAMPPSPGCRRARRLAAWRLACHIPCCGVWPCCAGPERAPALPRKPGARNGPNGRDGGRCWRPRGCGRRCA